MSLLSPHAIDEFQELWKKHYGIELSREEATARAHQLFTLVRLLNDPAPPHIGAVVQESGVSSSTHPSDSSDSPPCPTRPSS
jgi:hypothetical protein